MIGEKEQKKAPILPEHITVSETTRSQIAVETNPSTSGSEAIV